MSTAQIGWSVDDKEVLKSFQKQQQEVDKLKKKIEELTAATKRTVEDGKKGFDNLDSAIGSGIGSLTKMVAGLYTIDRVTGFVVDTYQDWVAESERLRNKHDALHKSVLSTISAAGQLARLPEFEERIKNVAGATPEQVRETFAAVQQSAPGLGFDRQMKLAEQAAPLAMAGVDLQKFGAALGDLAEAEPEKTAEQLIDLTAALREMAGEKFGEIASDKFQLIVSELKSAGMSSEQAMGLMIAGRQANVNPKTMEALAVALASQEGLTKARPGQRVTEEQRLKNEFLATGGARNRLALLQQRRDVANAVLGDDNDVRFRQILPAEIEAAAAGLSRPGSAAEMRKSLPESRAGAEAGMTQFLDELDKTDIARSRAERDKVVAEMNTFEKFLGHDPFDRWTRGFSFRFAADPEQEAIRQLELRVASQSTAVERGIGDPQVLKILEQMLGHMRNLDAKSIHPSPAINAHNER